MCQVPCAHPCGHVSGHGVGYGLGPTHWVNLKLYIKKLQNAKSRTENEREKTFHPVSTPRHPPDPDNFFLKIVCYPYYFFISFFLK